MSVGVEKAYIRLVKPPTDPKVAPSLSSVTGGGQLDEVEFMFNPSKYTVTKKATWTRGKSANAPSSTMPEFMGSEPASMKLDILLDHSDKENPTITRIVDMLLSAVVPTSESLGRKEGSPPWAVFGWGSRIPMVAVITSVSASYTLFKSDGTPIRAMCEVQLEEVPTDPAPRQNPTSGSDATLKQHTLRAGDTLQSVAKSAYGHADRWRDIARFNDIDDPYTLRPGDTVLVPSVEGLLS